MVVLGAFFTWVVVTCLFCHLGSAENAFLTMFSIGFEVGFVGNHVFKLFASWFMVFHFIVRFFL